MQDIFDISINIKPDNNRYDIKKIRVKNFKVYKQNRIESQKHVSGVLQKDFSTYKGEGKIKYKIKKILPWILLLLIGLSLVNSLILKNNLFANIIIGAQLYCSTALLIMCFDKDIANYCRYTLMISEDKKIKEELDVVSFFELLQAQENMLVSYNFEDNQIQFKYKNNQENKEIEKGIILEQTAVINGADNNYIEIDLANSMLTVYLKEKQTNITNIRMAEKHI